MDLLTADLETDLNTVRPIVAGGTGASTAAAALLAFGGAVATQTGSPINLGIAASVAASALTIALKGADGNDPSATNPVYIPFRNVTAATGTPSVLTVTAATSVVISSGSTLGAPTGSTPFKVWIVGFNDGGTFRLGAILCSTLSSGVLEIFPLGAWGIASSTAEGGAGGADTARTFYTGTAVTSKAYTVLAVLSFESGLATAGTWAAAPTRIQLFDASVPLPGQQVQKLGTFSAQVATGTTTLPWDDTIPQITEGVEFLTRAITPSSAANMLDVQALFLGGSSVNNNFTIALFQDAVADALAAASGPVVGTDLEQFKLGTAKVAGTTSSLTMRLRAGGNGAGTWTFNGASGGRKFGGVASSYLSVTEISA